MRLIHCPGRQALAALVPVLLLCVAPCVNAQVPVTRLADSQTVDSVGKTLSFGYATTRAETDGAKAYFYVAPNSSCATSAQIDSIPIAGGTATPLVSPISGISICDEDYLSGNDLYFHVQPLGSGTSDSGFYVVSTAGGSARDAVIPGDPSPIGPVYGVESSGPDGLGDLYVSLYNSANPPFTYWTGLVTPNGQLVADTVPAGTTCDGVTITASRFESATDGTVYANLLSGTSGGIGYTLITLASGAPSTACQDVVFKMRSDLSDVLPASFPSRTSLREIGVAHGVVYLGASGGDAEVGNAHYGIFALQSGALTEVVDGTYQFASAGNYIAFDVANGNGFGLPLNGLYGADMSTGQLQFVTAPNSGHTLTPPVQGALSADGHLVFVDSYSTATSPFFGGTLYAANLAVPSDPAAQLVPDGYYQLVNHASSFVLDDPASSPVPGTAIYQYPMDGGNNQIWRLAYNGHGFYTIQSNASQLFLTGTSSAPGTHLVQEPATDDDSQLWSFAPSSAGAVITNKATGLVLDDAAGTLAAGPSIILWPQNGGGINQNWTVQVPARTYLPGYYNVRNVSSGLVLDDPASSAMSGMAIYQWTADGGSNQAWYLGYNGAGFYTISNKSSGLRLTGTASGQSVVQAAITNDDTQLWLLSQGVTGALITNKATGLVLDEADATTALGPYVVMWQADGGVNQSWTLQLPPS